MNFFHAYYEVFKLHSSPRLTFASQSFFLLFYINPWNEHWNEIVSGGMPQRNLLLHLPAHTMPSWKLQASIYLANISLSALYLLLLAGDVNSNPGPIKDPCSICSKGCPSNQRAIQCDGCDKWHHAKCGNMGADEYFSLATNESSTWMCFNCLFP